MIAKIAVDSKSYIIDKAYSYLVDECLNVQVGSRVLVPFGTGDKIVEGVVLALEDDASKELNKLKKIAFNLDESPVIRPEDIKLALWMCSRYFCTFYSAIKTIVPSFLWYQYSIYWNLTDFDLRNNDLTYTEQRIVEILSQGPQEIQTIEKCVGKKLSSVLHQMMVKNYVKRSFEKKITTHNKLENYLALGCTDEEAASYCATLSNRSKKTKDLIEYLLNKGESLESEAVYYTGIGRDALKKLINRNIVVRNKYESFCEIKKSSFTSNERIILNDEQKIAFDEILSRAYVKESGITLLHGVTGSGKTKVYISLAQALIERNQSTMILVPEIALTSQMLSLFEYYLGDEVAILHSGLKNSERIKQWNRIKNSEVHVVLGTRSAVFAPLSNLSLIILDEEQEPSYISETSPCYHTEEIARYRSHNEGAQIVLGSATPKVTTMYHALNQDYHLAVLRKRYNNSMPNVIVSDMCEELRNGNLSTISVDLQRELKRNIENKEQSILYINRRGNSKQIVCPDCGYIPECTKCSAFLTYHSANNRLMCHHCGYSEDMIQFCPDCGTIMKHVGNGTQKIEEDIKKLFPHATYLRMDTDVVKNNHEQILKQFEKEKIDILIGTQMIAKGLDYENVTLVGIIDSDASLYSSSYLASERTFNLITQVVGRAGRGKKQGRALVQTLSPQNDVILAASKQDYFEFYKNEIEMRRVRNDPPFADLVILTISGVNERSVIQASKRLVNIFRSEFNRNKMPYKVYGPAPAAIVKVNNKFKYKITINGMNNTKLRGLLSYHLKQFQSENENRNISISITANFGD